LASYLGVLTGTAISRATISHLVGDFEEPAVKKDEYSPILLNGVEVVVVLRTRDNVGPLFILPGDLCDIEDVMRVVRICCKKYRIPERQRMAIFMRKD
jgi:deoxyribonuclease V